ncbi:unnamed protein product, partial [Arabidopsis halleri]
SLYLSSSSLLPRSLLRSLSLFHLLPVIFVKKPKKRETNPKFLTLKLPRRTQISGTLAVDLISGLNPILASNLVKN